MLSFGDTQTICQDLSSDTTASSLVQFKLYLNIGYKFCLAQLGRPVIERTQTSLTVASQQYYQLPIDYLFLKSVTILVGGIAYPILEEPSQDNWNILNATTNQTSDIPTRYFLRPSFGVAGAEIGFWPIPSSPNNTITVIYEATDKNLTQDAYNTGTVTASNNSVTVTGAGGASFTANMINRYFRITDSSGDGMTYRIIGVPAVTTLTLENYYQGVTTAGAAYEVVEMFNLPEELQILPCYFALAHYYDIKNNQAEEQKYWQLFYDQLKLGMRRWGTKSRSSLVGGQKYVSRFAPSTPLYFPTNVT